jgi:hypothetical protein
MLATEEKEAEATVENSAVEQLVERFERPMIERFLRSSTLKFLRDSDGDFIVQFAYDDVIAGSLSLFFIAEGSDESIYRILAMSDRRIPKENWIKAITLCNTWNRQCRWPKAYLDVRDPDNDTTATIHLESQIGLQAGVHQALLDDFSNITVAGAWQFWLWAHSEKGL